jgi:hypothetical protein
MPVVVSRQAVPPDRASVFFYSSRFEMASGWRSLERVKREANDVTDTKHSDEYLRHVRRACINLWFPICCWNHLRRGVMLSRFCHCPQKETKMWSTYLPFVINWCLKCSQWLVIVDERRADSSTRSTVRSTMGCCNCSNPTAMIILNGRLHQEFCWKIFSPFYFAQTAECLMIKKCSRFTMWHNFSHCRTAAVTIPNNRL